MQFVDTLLQTGRNELAVGMGFDAAEVAGAAAGAAAAAAILTSHRTAATAELAARGLELCAQFGPFRFRQVGVAQAGGDRREVDRRLPGRRQVAQPHRAEGELAHRRAVGIAGLAFDAQAVLHRQLQRLAECRVDAFEPQVEEALGIGLDPHRRGGQMFEEEVAAFVGGGAVFAPAAEVARTTATRTTTLAAAAAAAAIASIALQHHGRFRDRRPARVAHRAGDLVAGAEPDVVDVERLLFFDHEHRRPALGVPLGGGGQRPVAGREMGAAEEPVLVGGDRRQQALALAQHAQRVVVLGLRAQLGAGDAVALEIGDPAAHLAAGQQHQIAEFDLGADGADVLVELAG